MCLKCDVTKVIWIGFCGEYLEWKYFEVLNVATIFIDCSWVALKICNILTKQKHNRYLSTWKGTKGTFFQTYYLGQLCMYCNCIALGI